MKGDFTRFGFDRTKHYAGVLHQAGRVWLESDGNEDVLTRLSQLEQETRDIVGPSGVPTLDQCSSAEDGPSAFRISPIPGSITDFTIEAPQTGPGRFYVDGILCTIEGPTTYLHQPDLPSPPPLPGQGPALVYLEVWRRLITYLEDPSVREIALNGPDTAARLKTIAQVKCVALSAGSWTCATAKDHLPTDGQGTLTTVQPTNTQPDDVCRLPDPSTYTGRENHLYRVEIHAPGDLADAAGTFTANLTADAARGALSLSLDAQPTASQLQSIRARGTLVLVDGRGQSEILSVQGIAASVVTLSQPLNSDYPTTYHPVVSAAARFKWSKENAAFAAAVTQVEDVNGLFVKLTLSSLGRDAATALRSGDIVEICDDASELGPARGHLTYLTQDPDPDYLTVLIAQPLPSSLYGQAGLPSLADRHVVLRRWDGVGWTKSSFDPETTPDMDFGQGVHIYFGGSDMRSGNYWLFVARCTDGSVQILRDAPPMGIVRHRCPLAVIQINGSLQVLSDCRAMFPPLTSLVELLYVGGDGQEVMPDLTVPIPAGQASGPYWQLAQQLKVRVTNGGCAAKVCFTALTGGGLINGAGQSATVAVDANGFAQCTWSLNSVHSPGSPPLVVQTAEARLLAPDGTPTDKVVYFTANLSIAAEVAYDPGSCGILSGSHDVQAAIKRLASITNLVYLGGDGQTAVFDPNNPSQLLPLSLPLRVGVFGDCGPVNGVDVTFTASGNGKLSDTISVVDADIPQKTITTQTVDSEDGIAECYWRLDPSGESQTVIARITATDTASMKTLVTQIKFTAILLRARDVVYEAPPGCEILKGRVTVQTALNAMCDINVNGCRVTVGKGGQYPDLRTAMKALLHAEAPSWNICLLPGEHVYDGALTDLVKSGPYVSICACSHGTRLILLKPLVASGLSSFELAGMQVRVKMDSPSHLVLIDKCPEVTLRDLEMNVSGNKNAASANVPLVEVAMGVERLSLRGNSFTAPDIVQVGSAARVFGDLASLDRLSGVVDQAEFSSRVREIAAGLAKLKVAERKEKTSNARERVQNLASRPSSAQTKAYHELFDTLEQSRPTVENLLNALQAVFTAVTGPGTALLIRDYNSAVTLWTNSVTGDVCLYDAPGVGTLDSSVLKMLSEILPDAKAFTLTPGSGVLEAHGNQLTRIVVGESVIEQLEKIVSGHGGRLMGVGKSVLLSENTFAAGESCMVAERMSLVGNQFMRPEGRAVLVLGGGAVFMGNLALPPQSSELAYILRYSPAGDSTNNLLKVDVAH